MIPILQYIVPKWPYMEPDALICNRIIFTIYEAIILMYGTKEAVYKLMLHSMTAISITRNHNSLFSSQQVKGRGHWVL
jgi:hypothetical protein